MRTLRASMAGTITLALLGGVGGGAAAQDAEPTPAISKTSSLDYTDDGMKLDVYAPDEPGPWPVVVVVHGGNQSRYMFTPLARAIAAEGAVVYNIDASLRLSVRFSDATSDIACAVRFARATAAEHGGDATTVTLVGHSAGAATGLVVALAGDDFGDDCLVNEGAALVDFFVGYEGPYGFSVSDPLPGAPVISPSREEDPDLWRAIDAYEHIGDNPGLVVRLVHGDAEDRDWWDTPLDVSVELEQALRDAGYDSELTVVAGQGHSDIMDPGSDAADMVMQKVRESTQAPEE